MRYRIIKFMQKIAFGVKHQWMIQDTLGRGDAGEVLSVLSDDKSTEAVMKRPLQTGTGGSIMRQASQIENESRILARLGGIHHKQDSINLATPELLDTSPPSTSQTVAFFMVSQQVRGMALSEMIKKILKEGGQLSHLWLLTVISALFTLLNEVHRKDVLWNDVKMEHIFWEPDSKTIACIDWGNGLLLDSTGEVGGMRPSPIADYHQLIAEMTPLITTAASDLLWDLNWPLDHMSELDEVQIRLLEKRVRYMRDYLTARIIEKRGLINKQVNDLPDLEGLQELLTLAVSLQKAGEDFSFDAVSQAARQLFLTYVRKGDSDSCLQIVKNITEFQGTQNALVWSLLHELLLNLNVQQVPIEKISRFLFDQDWSNALWELHRHSNQNGKLERVMALIRLQGLPAELGNVLPMQLLQELSDDLHVHLIKRRLASKNSTAPTELSEISKILDALMLSWHACDEGSNFGQVLLELREVLQVVKPYGIKVAPQLNQFVSGMLSLTRSLYQSWQSGEMPACRKLLRTLHLWDPYYADLFKLDHDLQHMQDWLDRLMQGPSPSQAAPEFLRCLITELPDVSLALGQPAWLHDLIQSLESALHHKNLSNLLNFSESQGLPMQWLSDLDQRSLPISTPSDTPLDGQQLQILVDFHQYFKKDLDLTELLLKIKSALPAFYPYYVSIVHSLESIFTQSTLKFSIPDLTQAPIQDQPSVQEVIKMIEALQEWRQNVEAQNWKAAENYLHDWQDWAVAADCSQALRLWRKQIMPVFASINYKSKKAIQLKELIEHPLLSELHNASVQFNVVTDLWESIPDNGFNATLAVQIEKHLTDAARSFYQFWQGLLQGSSKGLRLLVQINQTAISDIYHLLQKLAAQSTKTVQALEVLSRPEMAGTRLAFNSAGDLIFALLKMDEVLIPKDPNSLLRIWQRQYLDFLKVSSKEAMQAQLAMIAESHPLYAWFGILSSYEFRRD